MPVELRSYGPNGWILPIKVTPKASKEGCMPLTQDATELPVKVSSPPDKGQANQAVIQVVAKALGVPKSSVTLLKGETSRHKQLLICHDSLEALLEKICIVWKAERQWLIVL